MQGLRLPYGHSRAFNLIKPLCQPVACQSLITCLLGAWCGRLSPCTNVPLGVPWGGAVRVCIFTFWQERGKKRGHYIFCSCFRLCIHEALRMIKVEIPWHGLRTMQERALHLTCLIRSQFLTTLSRQACLLPLYHSITGANAEISGKQVHLKWCKRKVNVNCTLLEKD